MLEELTDSIRLMDDKQHQHQRGVVALGHARRHLDITGLLDSGFATISDRRPPVISIALPEQDAVIALNILTKEVCGHLVIQPLPVALPLGDDWAASYEDLAEFWRCKFEARVAMHVVERYTPEERRGPGKPNWVL